MLLGRYPPVPKHPPIAFYSAVRLGDPEQLALIMATDPYFITQDNGAGAPVHFATTYKQLDMVRVVGCRRKGGGVVGWPPGVLPAGAGGSLEQVNSWGT